MSLFGDSPLGGGDPLAGIPKLGAPSPGGPPNIPSGDSHPRGWYGSENQKVPIRRPFGEFQNNLGETPIDHLLWYMQINRQQGLAEQQLEQYESGQLPKGTQDAINLATTEAQNTLGGEYAAMGRTGPDTSMGQGEQLIQEKKSIATQAALEQILANYNQSAGLEAQLTQGLTGAELSHEQNQVALIGEWLKFQLGEQQLKQQQEQSTLSMIGSIFGSLGSLAGGLGSLAGGGL